MLYCVSVVYDGFHRLAEWSINFLHSSRLPDSVIPWSEGKIIKRSAVKEKLVTIILVVLDL